MKHALFVLAASGKPVQMFKPLSKKDGARSVALDPEGKQVVGTFSNKIVVWDVTSGKELTRWEKKGATWSASTCDVSPDGHFCVVGGPGGKAICLYGMPPR
jgi:WD40 repeat protein